MSNLLNLSLLFHFALLLFFTQTNNSNACLTEWTNKCNKTHSDCCSGLFCYDDNGKWKDGQCRKKPTSEAALNE